MIKATWFGDYYGWETNTYEYIGNRYVKFTIYNKGYDELIEIDGEVVYQVFAIKKNNGSYSTYYYTVPKNKLDQAEDYEIEELNEFNELELAIKHIQSKGANLSRFNIFKGNKPL